MNKLLQKEMNAGNLCLIPRISILLLFVLFVTAHSFAQNTTISSGKFSDPAIWSDNTMPAPNDMVIIKAGNIIEFDTIATIDRLTIENGATLLIKNQHRITISNAITINGRLEVNEGDIDLVNSGSNFEIGSEGYLLWAPFNNTAAGTTLFINGVENFHETSTLRIDKWYNYSNTPLGSVVTGNFGNVEISTISNGLIFEWNQQNQFELHIVKGTLSINQAWVVLDKSGAISNTTINSIHLNNVNSYLDFHVGDHAGDFAVSTSEIKNLGGTLNGIHNGNGNVNLEVNGNFTNLGNVCLVFNSGIMNTGNGNSSMKVTGKYKQTHGDFRGIFNITTTNSGKSEIEINEAEITGGIFMANYGCHTAGLTSIVKINGNLLINLSASNGKFRGNGLTSLSGTQNNLKLQFTIGGSLSIDGIQDSEFISSASKGNETVVISGEAQFKAGNIYFNYGSHETDIIFQQSLVVDGGNVFLSKTTESITAVINGHLQMLSGILTVKGGQGNGNLIVHGNFNQSGGSVILHNNITEPTSNIIYLSVLGDFSNDSGNFIFDNNGTSTVSHQLSLNGNSFSLTGNAQLNAPVSIPGIIFYDHSGDMNYNTPGTSFLLQNIKQVISSECIVKLVNCNMQVSSTSTPVNDMLKVASGGILDLGNNQVYANQAGMYCGVLIAEDGKLRTSSKSGLYNGTANAAISSKGNMSYHLHVNSIVEYYGNEIQVITGIGTGTAQTEAQQYGLLEINKPAGKSLLRASDVFIRSGLFLNKGEVDLNGYNIVITSGKTYAITRDEGYIRSEADNISQGGQVKWRNIDNGLHIVPFGISSQQIIPVSFQPTKGFGKEFAVSTRRSATDNRPLPIGVTSLNVNGMEAGTDKILDRWYYIHAEGVTADVSLYGLPEENTVAGNLSTKNFSLMVWNNSKWNILGGTGQGSVTQNFSVTLNNCSTWGNTALVAYQNPKHADILQFSAELVFKQVNVAWTSKENTTATKYIIERTSNEETYIEVIEKDAMPHSASSQNFSGIDYNPLPGISYYRLKQIDADGTTKYSEAVKINNGSTFDSGVEIVNVAPNPFKEDFLVTFNTGTNGEVDITLSTLTGQKMHFETISVISGRNKFNYSSDKVLIPGIYLLNISDGRTKATQKLLKI